MQIRFYGKTGWGLGTVQNHSPICTAFNLHYNFDKMLLVFPCFDLKYALFPLQQYNVLSAFLWANELTVKIDRMILESSQVDHFLECCSTGFWRIVNCIFQIKIMLHHFLK